MPQGLPGNHRQPARLVLVSDVLEAHTRHCIQSLISSGHCSLRSTITRVAYLCIMGAGSSDREEMSARMPSYAIFAPLRPRAVDLGAGCLACGVCLKDCAVNITASFCIIAATTGFGPARIHAAAPGHLGTWEPGQLGTRSDESPADWMLVPHERSPCLHEARPPNLHLASLERRGEKQ